MLETPAHPSSHWRPSDHVTDEVLSSFRRQALPAERRAEVRDHLDRCRRCWSRWNRHRWDAADGHRLVNQLATYLGTDYRAYFDSSHALADEWDQAAPSTPDQVASFFRSSTSYLYNLVVWEASANRPDFVTAAVPALRRARARVVLDVGSGIGSDLLALSALGLQTMSCEYDGPSHRFARWRGTAHVPNIEPDQLATIGSFTVPDVLWVVDTLDHIEDVPGQLGPLLDRVPLLVTERLEHDRAHGRQRFHHRRARAELEHLIARHGLHPDPSETDAAEGATSRPQRDPTAPSTCPITCWTRR